MRRAPVLFASIASIATALVVACSGRSIHEQFVGSAMRQEAFGANPNATSSDGKLLLLAGDMHCHVAPPDGADDVSRDFDETVTLAKDHHLDFVLLTPHVWSRFFADASKRAIVEQGQTDLRATIAKAKADGTDGGVLFVPGFEYTDYGWGHVGASFANLDDVLADVSLEEGAAHPEKFFQAWTARGGTLVVNHPFVTPLDSIFAMARADLSWRAWTTKKTPPSEIQAIERLLTGVEAYNSQVTHLRDAILLANPRVSMDATMKKLDALVVAQRRRVVPAGGSDSHGMQLAATTWLLATSRTVEGVHQAIVEGRTCVRNPNACSFEVKVGDAWKPVGTALGGVDEIEVRANGSEIEVIANGEVVARPESETAVRVTTKKSECTVVRARVDEGMSAPIYANCF